MVLIISGLYWLNLSKKDVEVFLMALREYQEQLAPVGDFWRVDFIIKRLEELRENSVIPKVEIKKKSQE